jgi:TolB-like protein/Flp pilus assembly protein TadD
MISKTISHYKILKKLGEGGMGVVYKAEDKKLKRTVAVKFLPADLTRDAEAKKRFIHEAQAASALDHPNICTIHEIGETEDGQIFIVMAYYEGETVKRKLSSRPLKVDEIIEIALQAVDGLSEAHERGIVHRDIKSENLIVTPRGHVRIMDFGLAKLAGRTKLTKTGTTLGTVSYMSPEQTKGSEVDCRSDIWSLGVVLYEMSAGRLPFEGDYEQAVVYSILQEDPEPVTALRTGFPVVFEAIVNKCLAKDTQDRYQHVSELGVDLKRLKKTIKADAGRMKRASASSGGIRGKRRGRIMAAVIAACVVMAAAMVLILTSRRGTERPSGRIAAGPEWQNSVAVLPFRDFSPNKDQEHFCFGMTDAINDRLAQLGVLKVSSTTSVMRYRNTDSDIRDIGRELGVANVLEGSVQVENRRIRVRGQLISTETGFHVWSDMYERELESIFEVQDEVSQAIAEALKIKLTPEAVRSLTRERPGNMEAYEYYLKGMNRFTQALLSQQDLDVRSSESMFQEALKIDPGYALAYAGLAWLYMHHTSWTGDPESYRKFNQYADTAYEMGPESGSAIAVKAYKEHREGDFKGALRLFRTALSISPNNAEIQALTGYTLRQLGLYGQATAHLKKAVDLNPFYIIQYGALFMAYFMNGDFGQAIPYLDKVVELNPNLPLFIDCYAIALVMSGQQEKAEAWLALWEEKNPGFPAVRRGRAFLLARKGMKDEALALARTDWIYIALGMKDEVIAYINERIHDTTEYPYQYLKNNPLFDPLRDDDHFQEILKQKKIIYEDLLKLSAGL